MRSQGRHSDYDVELDTEKENSPYKGNECKSMEIHREGRGMTREEAIEALNEIFDDSEFNRYESWYGKAMDMAIKALRELPKRRKEVKRWKTKALKTEPKHEKWILCSERLPKNEDLVIVTIFDESGDTLYRYTDFGWYLEAENCWIIDAAQRIDVIAWMPLPKPYREDSEV